MQFAHAHLKNAKGQEFYKLWGSGKEGFNPSPDWNVYALLQVWSSEADADVFFSTSELIDRYQLHTREKWQLYLKNIISRGLWSGGNPFQKSNGLQDKNPFVIAITRATIKTKLLYRFWKHVPRSQQGLLKNKGLIYAKGFGEVPIKNMATFSVWKDKGYMDEFAYGGSSHIEAIKNTRELQWYSEELFSRFQPYRSIGTWYGKNPLPDLDPDPKEVCKK